MSITELADGIGRLSIVLMWVALAVRARPALRDPHQRGLWLAILTAATATTLFQPEVVGWAVDVTGDARAVTVARNVIGVVAAGLTILFVVDSARPGRARLLITLGTAGIVMSLLGMDLAQGSYPGPTIPATGGPADPSTVYWLVLCGAHLAADVAIVVICGVYSRRSKDPDLAWSLRLFAIGSALAALYWAGYLAHLQARVPDLLPFLAVVINLHGVSRALTLLVPTASRTARLLRDARTVWVLWPMWRDLSTAVPNVALTQPQATRLSQFLRPRSPLSLQAHRQTIETYDAILQLQSHLTPHTYWRALQRAQQLKVPVLRTTAAALAGAVGHARRAKLDGAPPTGPQALPALDQGGVPLLLAVARHWPTMSRTTLAPDPPHPTP
ncbi:MAB_1171c family putative transporter [Streptomyces sp. 4N509B]|uniref:MAB_1171c family putative transporter n=1 Tax=Streptomyces sp. 4N509B TaxID=3457413 RepID=UPI003FD15A2C